MAARPVASAPPFWCDYPPSGSSSNRAIIEWRLFPHNSPCPDFHFPCVSSQPKWHCHDPIFPGHFFPLPANHNPIIMAFLPSVHPSRPHIPWAFPHLACHSRPHIPWHFFPQFTPHNMSISSLSPSLITLYSVAFFPSVCPSQCPIPWAFPPQPIPNNPIFRGHFLPQPTPHHPTFSGIFSLSSLVGFQVLSGLSLLDYLNLLPLYPLPLP